LFAICGENGGGEIDVRFGDAGEMEDIEVVDPNRVQSLELSREEEKKPTISGKWRRVSDTHTQTHTHTQTYTDTHLHAQMKTLILCSTFPVE